MAKIQVETEPAATSPTELDPPTATKGWFGRSAHALNGRLRPSPSEKSSSRRSWRTLGLWVLVIAILAVLGARVAGRLTPMSLAVPGTPSAHAEAMLATEFGSTVPIAVLLRGPPGEVDRQGRRLVAALRGIRQVQVLSPWDGAVTVHSLRPHPGAAFVLVNYTRPASRAMAVVTNAEAVIERTVRRPVHSYLTGVAVIGRALQNATMADTEQAEMIALPILILVLLLVFRSPVAAAVPLAMGGATVMAGRGLLWLASFLTPINSLGIAIAAMMSLALGVDYALLMVSRVRQELADGWDHEAAVAIASRAAGRTIAAAGGTLALTMLAASAVATPGLLGPVAVGVVISGLLSVALALTAMPALLRLLGPSLNRWEIRLPSSRSEERRRGLGALAERLIAHPAITVPLILAGMLALAAPAGALRMGPPDASELPPSSPARIAVEMVERTIGPGWSAPFVIVASAHSGAITTPQRLRALMRWQETIVHEPDVAAVLGPASVAGAQRELAETHAALASAPKRLEGAQHAIKGLRSGLSHASDGVAELRSGLASAAAGAGSLSGGAGRAKSGAEGLADQTGKADDGAKRLVTETGRAHAGAKRLTTEAGRVGDGANQLQTGIAQAAAGSARLAGGIDEAVTGAEALATSDHQLTAGAAQLADGMNTLDDTVHTILAPIDLLAEQLHTWAGWIAALRASDQQLRTRLSEATHELDAMTVARGDPRYPALAQDLAAITQLTEQNGLSQLARIQQQLIVGLERLSELPAELSQLTASLDQLRAGADRLATGTSESEEGALRLDSTLHRLATGGHTLTDGLAGLSGGASQLAGGLGKLTNGNKQLATGLGKLTGGNAQLAGGLGKLVAGNAQLSGGLSSADSRTGALATGLSGTQRPLQSYASMLDGYQQDYRLLHADSPNALDSGYLVLTALDGTVSPMREQVAQLVNVDGGGQAARVMVIASSPPDSPATAALSGRLQRSLPALAAATGSKVEIGQGAQYLLDYTNANTTRFPWLVLALAIVAVLTLIVVLRALLLPLIAVALNLATIAVALGALELLTEEHVLGGPGYIDAASGAGILSIMFVLSIDYEVFLLTRMREQWVAQGNSNGAISYGLRHTAGVIRGSAAIMTAVFLAFAAADVIPLRQFGVGLTIAVLLDATIVRLVLLPAIMRRVGPRIWWLPAWLDRRLPNIEHMSSQLATASGGRR
ncbi:MAG TPA: MMPL family transporter [Solirubrobacteraceae bacterium]|nr:MMPL family transporter [Solirubrobacteraceae bacterium]